MTDRPPDFRYRALPGDEEAEDTGTGVAAGLIRLLTWLILLFCLLVWAVVGAVFWVPLILRTMVLFSVALVQATLEGTSPTAAAGMLRDSVSFYRRGFVVAVEAVMREREEEVRDPRRVNRRLLVREMAWAALVWYVALLLLGIELWSPVDAWNWITSLPWAGWLDRLLARGEPIP